MPEEMISKAEAAQQVRQMGRMMATLYYHMSCQVIDAVGIEQGKEIIGKAILALGTERGQEQCEKVVAMGYDHIPENYGKVPDLPALGWDVSTVENPENDTHVKITYCPFAQVWQEKDFAEIGRLYCFIDQAKYTGFHSDCDLTTLKNVLEGADYCEMVCRHKK